MFHANRTSLHFVVYGRNYYKELLSKNNYFLTKSFKSVVL